LAIDPHSHIDRGIEFQIIEHLHASRFYRFPIRSFESNLFYLLATLALQTLCIQLLKRGQSRQRNDLLSEIKFFDRLGRARAYCLDGVHIYLWDGTPAAFLRNDRIHAFDGSFVGWLRNGWIRDRAGNCCFLQTQLAVHLSLCVNCHR
jgi:hypothetical protein